MSKYQHDIEKYLKGELSPAERHALEKKALDDPFLADALEGAEQLQADTFSSDVAELNEVLTKKQKASLWIWPMRIAAGLVFILVSTIIVWQATKVTETTQPITYQNQEQETSAPIRSDSSANADADEEASSVTPQPSKDIAPRSTPIKTDQKDLKSIAQGVTTQPVDNSKDVTEIEKIIEAKPAEKVEEAKAEELILATKSAEEDRAKKESIMSAAPTAKSQVRSTTAALSRKIKGKVTSAEDGSALPGVNVVLKGTTIGTVTNAKGEYEIVTTEQSPTLVYAFIGLNTTEVNAASRSEIDVSLTTDATQLSEVIVTGYGISKADSEYTPTVDLTHPTIGYRKFKQYLQDNLRYPQEAITKKIEGRVRVEFTVETDGLLSNFIILKSIGSGCDEELIRLIKEGPQWVPTKKDNVATQDKARVELRFKLPK
jgi:TonB family protein